MRVDQEYRNDRILLVDDEQKVLDSYKRILHGRFHTTTALGGKQALDILASQPPFKVVISDIKMPRMDGITFLSQVRDLYPDSIRMVLTGYANLEMAMNTVNQGAIFRFLTKPCKTEDLITAIKAGVDQHSMVQAARELAIISRIKEGLEGTLRAFTRLVEFRDPYTAGHMDRVAHNASLIATRHGLDQDRMQGLYLAGLVHDIGKIAIPSGILNKPGKLSDAEFAIIKTHPLVGAEAFATLDTQWPISRMIIEHHERIDGSGYPYGRSGDEILEESKILAVADIIDATLTLRPYRTPLAQEKCISILQHARGKELDAQFVDTGIALIEEGIVPSKPSLS